MTSNAYFILLTGASMRGREYSLGLLLFPSRCFALLFFFFLITPPYSQSREGYLCRWCPAGKPNPHCQVQTTFQVVARFPRFTCSFSTISNSVMYIVSRHPPILLVETSVPPHSTIYGLVLLSLGLSNLVGRQAQMSTSLKGYSFTWTLTIISDEVKLIFFPTSPWSHFLKIVTFYYIRTSFLTVAGTSKPGIPGLRLSFLSAFL